jgi:hypothetical protein
VWGRLERGEVILLSYEFEFLKSPISIGALTREVYSSVESTSSVTKLAFLSIRQKSFLLVR